MSEAPKEQEKKATQLNNPARIKLAEHDFSHYSVTAELGTTLEDILSREYFAHFASKFKPYDEITVRVDDGTYYAKLLVLAVGRAWVKTTCIMEKKLSTADVEQSQAATYDIIWRGPACKFSVVKKSDKGVLKDGFATKVEAAVWATENA